VAKVNSKFIAITTKGINGPLYITRHEDVKLPAGNLPVISVHKASCSDFDFNPFMDNMIATASDDYTVGVTTFPVEGLKESITEATAVMKGHNKRVSFCSFHPTASNILASGSADVSVKVWNVEKAEAVATYDGFKDILYSLEWNYDGSLLAVTTKDRTIATLDPRQLSTAQSFPTFESIRSSKLFWAQKFGWIGATGFAKAGGRQLKLFDLRKSQNAILTFDIDKQAAALIPYWNNDNGVLYLSAKGDNKIAYYELENDSKMIHLLNSFSMRQPHIGGGWFPKRCMDVWKCEINRYLEVSDKWAIPTSFFVPRKMGADVFQSDIFPDTYANEASLTAEEWLSGKNNPPVLVSMKPNENSKPKTEEKAPSNSEATNTETATAPQTDENEEKEE